MRMSASAEASEFRNSPCGSATISIRRPRGNSALMPFAVSAATLRRNSAFIEAPQTAIDDIDHRLAATEEVDIAGKCLRAPLDGPLCIGAKGRYGSCVQRANHTCPAVEKRQDFARLCRR